MNRLLISFLVLTVSLTAVLFGGCARKPILRAAPVETTAPAAVSEEGSTGARDRSVVTTAVSEEPSIRKGDWESVPSLRTILFGYDRDALSDEAREILKKNTEYLKANPSLQIIIEGHTDERGTIAYNLALGQRRASMVREFYGKLGISQARIGTISFGEEKPADPRHNDAAWARNRRAETKIRKAS